MEKAYKLNLSKIDQGYLYSEVIVYAETRGKAKLLIDLDEYTLSNGDDCTFLNLPIKRAKEYDKIEFEGNWLIQYEVDQIFKDRKRIKKLNSFLGGNSRFCYIQKGSYYRPNSRGYTDFKHKAGIYTIEEGVSHALSCQDIWLEIIDVAEHNKMIEQNLKELKKRLII